MYFLSILLFHFVTKCTANLPEFTFIHRIVLDQRNNYVLLWTPQEEKVIFEIQVATHGYVGLGFSTTGGMRGSDIVIGWIDNSGRVVFHDRHATGNKTPVIDKSQDYELLGAIKNQTHTVFRFSRPWRTCDNEDDIPLTEETVRIIWAYDARLPNPLRPDILNMHDHRGTKSVYLKEHTTFKIPSNSEAKIWDVLSPEIEVPEDLHTLYWCKLYKAPQIVKKTQVIGYIPLISERNLPHVHHILFYECSLDNSDHYLDKWVSEKGAQCYSNNMPVVWSACGSPMIAWAIGSQGEMFPEHVGFPIGEKHGGSTYYLMETHFDVPVEQPGLIVQSGLRLFITNKPRQYDAGILTLGHKVEPTMIIPPAQIWDNVAHCTSECTRKTIPPEGIRVISGILHSHTLGRKIKLQLIRNDIEQEIFLQDENYDSNYQQNRKFKKEKLIKQGDHLITTCTYNSMRKSKPTFGGFGNDDEMCLVFLMYYPRIDISQCYSRPDLANLLYTLGIKNLYDNSLIVRLFSQDSFTESLINENEERLQLSHMRNDLTLQKETLKLIKLVDFFRIVNISAPPELNGKSLYDVVMDSNLWRNMTIVRRLERAITSHQYEPSCLASGRRQIPNMARKAKFPRYIPHRNVPPTCVEAKQTTTVQPALTGSPDVDVEISKAGASFEPLPSNELARSRQRSERKNTAINTVASKTLILLCVLWLT